MCPTFERYLKEVIFHLLYQIKVERKTNNMIVISMIITCNRDIIIGTYSAFNAYHTTLLVSRKYFLKMVKDWRQVDCGGLQSALLLSTGVELSRTWVISYFRHTTLKDFINPHLQWETETFNHPNHPNNDSYQLVLVVIYRLYFVINVYKTTVHLFNLEW